MEYMTSYYWNAGAGGLKNEDSLSLQRVSMKHKEAAFLLVCDGIGGLKAGEWASGFVAEQMTCWFWERAVKILGRRRWEKALSHSALRQLMKVQEEMEWYEKEQKMRCGTTCTMAVVCQNRYVLLHSGDSRAYLLGKKERQLTADHQLQGRLARCMGDFGFQRPDILRGRMSGGEILLLCTDGFCSSAPAGFFGESLQQNEAGLWGLEQIGRFLLAHGEQDNLTAAALQICRKGAGRWDR